MELVIVALVALTLTIVISIVFKINIKKLKEIGMEDNLNKLSEKYPSNIEICRDILKKLNNEDVKIEEDKDSESTLYLALTNKIFIADTKKSYTRIQTMAHECLHSIQDRRILMFNFIFSNIYILYFIVVIALTIFKVLDNTMLYINIFLLLSITYYMVRVFLENDAMIKAKYLAKEYMQEKGISTKEEIEEITNGFSKLNDLGIKAVNYKLFQEILVKVIIFSIGGLIF